MALRHLRHVASQELSATIERMKPKALKPGDTLGIVSPASPLTPEKLERGTEKLRARGYKIKLMPNALAADGYLAGTDEQRASDMMAAFHDPEVDGVYCSRGGYGCARIMPMLDLDFIANSGKPFLGYSDVTTLHLALTRRGTPSIYCPMPITLTVEREPWVYESLFAAMEGGNAMPASAPPAECIVPGVAEGMTTGGCMCLLTDSLATSDALDCAGRIVVIEDVDENPHRIDAMLTHLLNEGSIKRAAGIVIGEMTRTDEMMDETIGTWPWRRIVRDRLEPLGIPMVFGFPFGHMSQMLSVPMGIRARLDATEGRLTYLESPCA